MRFHLMVLGVLVVCCAMLLSLGLPAGPGQIGVPVKTVRTLEVLPNGPDW
jgi:hypothetical protein